MQLFPCPFCGPRDETEFFFGGDAGKTRPPREASEADWARYLHMKKNPKGAARELWIHSGGCGRFFYMERDTVTHVVAGSEAVAP
jgi:sarcosine oxidase subunit delta